jgi:hypothetical protein
MDMASPLTEQQQMMKDNGVVQNILNIPLIEIEQLSPRVRKLVGAMKCRYRAVSEGADPDSGMNYEYSWIAGDVIFVDNPIPRAPVGTGKVAFLPDDENDPRDSGEPLPEGSLSGHLKGWNREFLASHYGEGFWRIVDENIDAEIRDRYRSILTNKRAYKSDAAAYDDKTIDKMIEEAVLAQKRGIAGRVPITVTKTSSTSRPVTSRTSPAPSTVSVENHPLFQQLLEQNKKLTEKIDELSKSPAPKQTKKARNFGHQIAPQKAPQPAAASPVTGNLG